MRKRYFCDYCEKSFIDDQDARKKHLESSFHIKLRTQHYDLYRDPKLILDEESKKNPCRRFQTNGVCQFASACKYTHYTTEQLWDLRQQLEAMKIPQAIYVPSLDSWQDAYNFNKDNIEETRTIPWIYHKELEHRTDLPPSLKKFDPYKFHVNNPNWG